MRIGSCQDMEHLLMCLYTLNATSKIVGVLQFTYLSPLAFSFLENFLLF